MHRSGGTDEAITFLQQVDPKLIKNFAAQDKLITYLQLSQALYPGFSGKTRNLTYVIVATWENTLLICLSQTDKNSGGMSWSKMGSGAKASVTALVKNNEYKQWFETNTLNFTFVY